MDLPEVEPVTDVKALTHLFFFCVCVRVSTQKLHDTSPRLLMALSVACLGNHWIAWLHVCVCKHKCVHKTMSDDSKKNKVEHTATRCRVIVSPSLHSSSYLNVSCLHAVAFPFKACLPVCVRVCPPKSLHICTPPCSSVKPF